MSEQTQAGDVSRRGFIRTTTAAAVSAGVALAGSARSGRAFAAGSDVIRVGLIGCGGRGTGAATDCLTAAEGVKLVAMGDAFDDRLKSSRAALAKQGPERFAVTDETSFVGLDAYRKVIASDVDLVILATPPAFRHVHLAAAVEAGKHVFAEKPVAVDGPGVRSVLASAEVIRQKNLAFVAGTQRRHDDGYRETVKRIKDGAIGEVVAGYAYWNQGGLWLKPRQQGWSDLEWELRNWLYFTWLSGDHIVEQHVHNLDVMNWIIGATPVSAYSLGGRQVRTDPAYGQIFDHFATEYEYPGGVKVLSMCRQIDGTTARVAEDVVGTKGRCAPSGTIRGETSFHYKRPEGSRSPYQQEHVDLVNGIRAGKPLNECKQVAQSTMTAIMGRMSAYTGKLVTWEQAMASQQVLMPEKLAFGPVMPVPAVAVPGKDPLI